MKALLWFCLSFLFLNHTAHAEVWVSLSGPLSFQYSSPKNTLYQFDQSASVQAKGWSFLAKMGSFPLFGFSRFQLEAPPLNHAIKGTNHFELQSSDIGLDLSGKTAKFLLGYGIGKLDFLCSQSDCQGLSFTQLELHQYFSQLGVPIGTHSDVHLDFRRIIGRVQIKQANQTDILHLQGVLTSVGFRLGF